MRKREAEETGERGAWCERRVERVCATVSAGKCVVRRYAGGRAERSSGDAGGGVATSELGVSGGEKLPPSEAGDELAVELAVGDPGTAGVAVTGGGGGEPWRVGVDAQEDVSDIYGGICG